MAETGMGIWYPNNYSSKADVLTDLKKLADSVDTILMQHESNLNNLGSTTEVLETDNTTNKTNIFLLQESLNKLQEHFVITTDATTNALRIWDLDPGIYVLDSIMNIYYKGATSDVSISDGYLKIENAILIVAEGKSSDIDCKTWILFNGGRYYHEEWEQNGFITAGLTTETDGTYYQYAINDLEDLKDLVNTLNHKISQLQQSQQTQNTQIELLQQENAQLKNQIPAGQASGEAIVLEDSSDLEFKAFDLGGNHKQEIRSGYQLVDFSQEPDELTRATYNFEEDVITVASANAEATGQAYARYIITDIIKNNAGKTLKFACGSFDFSNGNSPIVQLTVVYNDGTSSKYITLLSSSSNNTYAIANDTSNIDKVYLNIICNNIGSIPGAYNITITKPKFYFGTEDKEYEKYGVAPSIEYPSPIEAVGENGSVNEVVGNKNLLDINAETIKSTYGGNLIINDNEIFFESTEKKWSTVNRIAWVIELPDDTKDIYISAENVVRPYITNAGLLYKFVDDKLTTLGSSPTGFTGISNVVSGKQIKVTPTAKYLVIMLQSQYVVRDTGETENRTVTINNLMVSYSTDTDYQPYEEQNIAMPCQQSMVGTEDYFDWDNEEEVHGWGKVIIDGTNGNITIGAQAFNDTYARFTFEFLRSLIATGGKDFMCDKFKLVNQVANIEDLTEEGIVKRTISKDNWCQLVIRRDRLTDTTVEALNNWLADNNFTLYYPLATPTRLPFTPEQKAIKEQIKALHSYKNVTHIFSTDEVAPVANVTYYKDLETELAKRDSKDADLQQQINNITELLSTTETSALLLDNYETDLESEVNEI